MAPGTLKEQDIQMMLAAKCHLGTRNCDYQMERYVYRRKNDGVHVINLGKTYEKLQLAARIIVAIENPQDIIVLSARPYGQRAVLKFAQHTGCKALAGRHTPGTFTNQIHKKTFEEPRLLIITDPRTDHQPIKEASYVNIPTIAFCDTDSPLEYVDVAIPANNKAKESIGCLYYLLARMVLQMRGTIPYQPWEEMVDMFFYREPEEVKEEGEAEAAPEYQAAPQEYAGALPGDFGEAPDMSGGFGAPLGGFAAAPAPADANWGGGFDAAPAPMDGGFGMQQQPQTDFGAQY